MPRLAHVLPVVAGVGAALVLFFFQKDLGPALLLSLMFLSLFAVARGGGWIAGAGLATLVAGFAVGYLLNISNTLAARVAMWQSPWDNAVRGGDQIAQAMWGLAAGASAGTGAGLGQTRFVPESHTDLVFASIGEELGLIGLLVVAATFFLIVWRGLAIARRASSDYRFFLALALTMSLAVPVLVMAAGTLGLLPLTGVVTPFLSYGGSAMVANFAMLGLLVAIDREKRPAADLAPFQVPVRWLGRVAAAGAVIAVVMAATVQTLRADDYLVRPQLGLQADGGRRFQYNPRVLEVLRSIPRGTIYDRRGLPIASGDLAALTKAAPEFGKLGQRDGERVPGSIGPLLPGRARAVSRAGRCEHASELECGEQLVRRTRRRGPAARLRRSREDRRDHGSRRPARAGRAPRLQRDGPARPAPLRAGPSRREGRLRAQSRRARDD